MNFICNSSAWPHQNATSGNRQIRRLYAFGGKKKGDIEKAKIYTANDWGGKK